MLSSGMGNLSSGGGMGVVVIIWDCRIIIWWKNKSFEGEGGVDVIIW